MFEEIGANSFKNRQHTGEYAEVAFDTYVEYRGKEEVQPIDTTIHYYEEGTGAPLILVHGIGQTSYTWRNNFKELAQKYHVYAIDLPGHGFSGRPEMSYSIEEFALAIEAFMNAKKIVTACFCVFGEATGYVLDFTIHNPERVRGVVLVSPVMSGGNGLLKGRGMLSMFGMVASKMMINQQMVRNALEDCYFDRTLVTDEVVDEYCRGLVEKDFKVIARLCMNNYLDGEILDALAGVKVPILVVVGGDDKITGGSDSEVLKLTFGNGSFVVIRNCGYLAHEEKPQKVHEAVFVFLDTAE